MTGRVAFVLLAALALSGFSAATVAAPARGEEPSVGPDDGWEDVVTAAAEAARQGGYQGEVVWATWETGAPTATLLEVSHRDGIVDVRVDRSGPGGAARSAGLEVPGSIVGVVRVPEPTRLAEKYRVSSPSRSRVLDRSCAVLEVRHRATDDLRERLWVDVDTGLLLRRESYEGDRLLRLAAFLSLEQHQDARGSDGAGRPARSSALAAVPAADGAVEVNQRGIEALRAAGWTIRERLPGGYRLEGVYAHGGPGVPPLQTVYGDGLYVVSLFEQKGAPDWSSLPPGAEPAEELGPQAFEWPGTSPRRLVWSGGETTFTLVGDPPPTEFRRMVAALPHEAERSWLDRLLSSVGRWWREATAR